MLSFDQQSWLFLREFTREIFVNVNASSFRNEVRGEIRSKLMDVIKNKDYVIHEVDSQISHDDLPKVKFAEVIPNKPVVVVSKAAINVNPVVEQPINLGKVSSVLVGDVFVVECQGPGKPLVVKKPGGKEESTSVSLSEDDIKRVIADFADLAKIYPTEGVFNASYKNYSITAVISELAGSRFIITKYLDVKKLMSAS